jgi:hypothetical protein
MGNPETLLPLPSGLLTEQIIAEREEVADALECLRALDIQPAIGKWGVSVDVSPKMMVRFNPWHGIALLPEASYLEIKVILPTKFNQGNVSCVRHSSTRPGDCLSLLSDGFSDDKTPTRWDWLRWFLSDPKDQARDDYGLVELCDKSVKRRLSQQLLAQAILDPAIPTELETIVKQARRDRSTSSSRGQG